MITISLKDLIYIVPDLLTLFLSGFIYMSVYNWLNNNETNISLLSLWSILISFIIKAFYSTLHSLVFLHIIFSENIKVLIYSATGVVLAFLCSWLKNRKIIHNILFFTNNKSINNDIFDDIIDYKKPTMLQIYLKGSNIFYIGKFCFREEKELNSWFVLIDYYCVDKETYEVIYDPDIANQKSSVAINLKDIERIEIIYEDDSDVWERLSGENETDVSQEKIAYTKRSLMDY